MTDEIRENNSVERIASLATAMVETYGTQSGRQLDAEALPSLIEISALASTAFTGVVQNIQQPQRPYGDNESETPADSPPAEGEKPKFDNAVRVQILKEISQDVQTRREEISTQLQVIMRGVQQLKARDQQLNKAVRVLADLISEMEPVSEAASSAQTHADSQPQPELPELPLTSVIEAILSEAGPVGLHRKQIHRQLANRGFPCTDVRDVAARLSYLKRNGRVTNPARGYWQLS